LGAREKSAKASLSTEQRKLSGSKTFEVNLGWMTFAANILTASYEK